MTEDQLDIFHIGTQYHLTQGLGAVLALLLISQVKNGGRAKLASSLLLVGCWIFAGSLYALALSAPKWVGAITPFGGLAFISAWVILAPAGIRETA